MITSYVALGDSFTEGVGDVEPSLPNGVRGWADRVADVLAGHARAVGEEFRYANLAIRGRKIDGILAEQIEPTVAMAPDLITIYAGANDVLRPKVDIDRLIDKYDDGLAALAATGARLLVFTSFDPASSPLFKTLRGRWAIYSEQVRWAAERHGAEVVDYWRMHEYRDWAMWDPDRLHMSALGHQQMARRVLEVLGVEHDIPPIPPGRDPRADAPDLKQNIWWAREHLAPWIHRRVTGRSSGDNLVARWPELAAYPPA